MRRADIQEFTCQKMQVKFLLVNVTIIILCWMISMVKGGLRGAAHPVKPEKRLNKIKLEVFMRAFW